VAVVVAEAEGVAELVGGDDRGDRAVAAARQVDGGVATANGLGRAVDAREAQRCSSRPTWIDACSGICALTSLTPTRARLRSFTTRAKGFFQSGRPTK
jgi:hypothetical protein